MTVATELERPPKYLHVPEHVGSYGPEVADLAAAVGMDMDPEQQLMPNAAYAYDGSGRLVSTELGCAAPRQNIKTHAGKACAVADLALFGEPDCLWTAQLRETSDDAFRNDKGTGIADLFDSYDFLRRLVARNGITDSDGRKSLTLRPRAAGMPSPSLRFVTRGTKAGRGLTGRRITHDEALFLKPNMVAAMTSILSAESMTGQVQVRYLGSPGLLESQVWREIRDKGRAGNATSLAWLEWAATRRPCLHEDCTHLLGSEGCVLDDSELIREANLAVDRRIHLRFVLEVERERLTPEDFMAERMGWWQDPPNSSGGDLDVTRWLDLADPDAGRGTPVVFGVDVGEDRAAWVAVAWRRSDGAPHVMLAKPRMSVLKAPEVLKQLVADWGGKVMLGGPAAMLEQDLPFETELVSGPEFATACGKVEDLLSARAIRHGNQPELNDAVRAARWRSVGTSGERAFQLKDAVGVGPLAAATRALYGLLFTETAPPPAPVAITTSGRHVDDGDISSIDF